MSYFANSEKYMKINPVLCQFIPPKIFIIISFTVIFQNYFTNVLTLSKLPLSKSYTQDLVFMGYFSKFLIFKEFFFEVV